MSNKFELRVAELMCSRLCHDLISPISAINNGVELLNEGNNGEFQDSLALIKSSAMQAVDRLSYFRIAFGAGGVGEVLLWKEIQTPLKNFIAERGIDIIWNREDGSHSKEIPKLLGRLLLRLVHLATECLPRGGMVLIDNLGDDEFNSIEVKLEGPNCILRDDVRSGLQPNLSIDELSVRNVVAYLTASLAASLEKSLEVKEEPPEKIVFSIL